MPASDASDDNHSLFGPGLVKAQEREFQAERIRYVEAGLRSILGKYEAIGPITPPTFPTESTTARAFLSHGGMKSSLEAVEGFLRSLGIEPVTVEREGSGGREVHGNVDHHRDLCDFAIVIWTKDVQDADGNWLPSGSVSMEAGELRVTFGNQIIFLAEEGVKLHTLGGTIVYQTFSDHDLAPAFQKIVTELRSWGWLTISPSA